ncbi:hypothetical protein L873DRAFT_1801080, partial [Choiromyces venosus 120613-1]
MEGEDSEGEGNQVQNMRRRKGKKVLRLSHISGYEKLPNLMIGEDSDLRNTSNTESLEVFSDTFSNAGSIYSGMTFSIYNNKPTYKNLILTRD